MRDEVKAGMLVALAASLVIGGVLLASCDDGPDLIGPPRPVAVTAGPGCAPPPPADAGQPDALDCTCPDKAGNCAIPACGVFCCF